MAGNLEDRGYAAQPVNVGGQAGISVTHRAVTQLSETVHVAPAADGGWWFWWSWNDPIAPVNDVHAAAFKTAYVLMPQAHD